MRIEEGCVATLRVKLRAIDASRDDDPELVVALIGSQPLIPGLVEALVGREAGDRLALDGVFFGPREPKHIVALPLTHFSSPPSIGDTVSTQRVTHQGSHVRQGHVLSVDAEAVHVDTNHPLAGQTLSAAVEVLAVRAATPEETHHGTALCFPFDVLAERPADLQPFRAHCMVPTFPWGHALIGQLWAEHIHRLPGDLIELGVGLGGTTAFLASLAKDRTVYACDTYEGLPQPGPADNPYWLRGLYRSYTSLAPRVSAYIDSLGLSNVELVVGPFADTLPRLSTQLCFAHLDSDLYDSVAVSLAHAWDALVDGGVLLVDDFFHPAGGPARAVADFFRSRGLQPILHVSFPYAVYAIKGESGSRAHRSLDGNVYALDGVRRTPGLRASIEASRQRLHPSDRRHANAQMLLDALDDPHHRAIYRYQASLEAFWSSIAEGFRTIQAL